MLLLKIPNKAPARLGSAKIWEIESQKQLAIFSAFWRGVGAPWSALVRDQSAAAQGNEADVSTGRTAKLGMCSIWRFLESLEALAGLSGRVSVARLFALTRKSLPGPGPARCDCRV